MSNAILKTNELPSSYYHSAKVGTKKQSAFAWQVKTLWTSNKQRKIDRQAEYLRDKNEN